MQISVLGTVLNIQTDESREHVDQILEFLNSKLEEIEQSLPIRDPLRKSIIANILIIDDLFKAESRAGLRPVDNSGNDDIAERIIARIDDVLTEDCS